MGLDLHFAKFLKEAKAGGVSFASTLMLGRQDYQPGNKETKALFGRACADRWQNPYAEDFFRALGAEKVQSMDASAYEGAEIIHDLNHPIPAALKGKFDVVCDGGTLEHVLNLPMGFQNAADLCAPGGHLVSVTPANNQMGHGFFQFSPDLWFTLFNPACGFEVVRMVAVELAGWARYYEVRNVGRERAMTISKHPVNLMTLVKKLGPDTALDFRQAQPLYAAPNAGVKSHLAMRKRLLEFCPYVTRGCERIWTRFKPRNTFRNRRVFKPITL